MESLKILVVDDEARMRKLVKDFLTIKGFTVIEAEDGEVYLYRYSEDENGQPNLENIEDDDEYEIVADAFDELLDEQEYDELVGEDELDQ
mgnify:CR=1 FL=1